jgi:glutaredoxin
MAMNPFDLIDPANCPHCRRIDASLKEHNPLFRDRIFGTEDGWGQVP